MDRVPRWEPHFSAAKPEFRRERTSKEVMGRCLKKITADKKM